MFPVCVTVDTGTYQLTCSKHPVNASLAFLIRIAKLMKQRYGYGQSQKRYDTQF